MIHDRGGAKIVHAGTLAGEELDTAGLDLFPFLDRKLLIQQANFVADVTPVEAPHGISGINAYPRQHVSICQ